MATYLLVAHQTAESPELLSAARDLASGDPDAEFVLLVPATPVAKLLVWEEGETAEVAERAAQSGAARLRERGLRVRATQVGDANPLMAIGDELRLRRAHYAAILISTLPPGISRWLGLDLPTRARRQFPRHRVLHVASAAPVTRSGG